MATIFFFFFLCISGQQLLQITTLHHQHSTPDALHTIGVSVDNEKLNEVSSSILMAENWLRTYVLSQYPSRNITSIVVFHNRLCDETHEQVLISVLFAMGNVYHSLVRWGLEKKIRVSVFFTPKCVYKSHLKPVFQLLEEINSTYTVKLDGFSDEYVGILSSELKSMADLRVFRSKTVNVMVSDLKSPGRKLLLTVPSDAAAVPLPPLIGVTPPPMVSVSPERQPPATGPVSGAQSPYGFDLPPCNPYPSPPHSGGGGGGGVMAPPPLVGDDGAPASPPFAFERLWCVAKPSVPVENLQEAMDYACGEGGADCGPISPTGSCYFPDSVVAHASYAFNSYWQKNKKNGGTCGFGGTAMLINSDPSFNQCHFTIA
ncbi:hypothetical protein QVD17_18726 [Tagetes erecta]|uniref:X8 domain-containing protein n=1 Tax=Tagetes erecta TaxID=13708 RepID=A0AAD8NVZ1_TARER|nr:hypothetical protein QVD17_18726 [Tagetes erecta]